jgi:hypothetical protein
MTIRNAGSWFSAFAFVCAACVPSAGFGQSLSSALGATNLDGLTKFNDCNNQALGYREKLMADRIEAKLAQSPALTPQARDVWVAEVKALRAVTPTTPKFTPPDPKLPQLEFVALTEKEQQAIQTMSAHHTQEIQLECEKKFGGMTRYSPGADQSGQKRYESELKAKLDAVEVTDIATIPVTALPSPFPKTQEEIAAERKAQQQARRQQQQAAMQGATQNIMACQEKLKGLRMTMMADRMQKNLEAAKGLSAKEKADYEADIASVRAAGTEGLQMPKPVDPANPMRAMGRLSADEQLAMTTEFSQQYTQQLLACSKR